ncbi:MAG TPA: M23 family metallopeptidase [Hymenobacter sp.]|jgi:murein DD-endopeptidase MepM/ murein hydrolase activator NlpD
METKPGLFSRIKEKPLQSLIIGVAAVFVLDQVGVINVSSSNEDNFEAQLANSTAITECPKDTKAITDNFGNLLECKKSDGTSLDVTGSQTGGIGSAGGYTFPLKTTQEVVKKGGWCHTCDKSQHKRHPAADLVVPPGTVVVAMADHTRLTRKRADQKCHNGGANDRGGYPTLQFKGVGDDPHYYFYAHLEPGSVTTKKNVKAGDVIGVVGKAACGMGTPHLHIQWAKEVINGDNQSDDIQRPLARAFTALPQ